MNKIFSKTEQTLVSSAVSKKFTSVTVSRGKTAWPKSEKDLTNFGIRFDFDGETTQDGVVYNKFQVQPNSGKVPSTVQLMFVKKDGTADDVKMAFNQFEEAFKK